MAKKDSKLLNFVAWFTGVVVSLTVGFGLINGILTLPSWLGGETVVGGLAVVVVGWVVVVTTLASIVLIVLKK